MGPSTARAWAYIDPWGYYRGRSPNRWGFAGVSFKADWVGSAQPGAGVARPLAGLGSRVILGPLYATRPCCVGVPQGQAIRGLFALGSA